MSKETTSKRKTKKRVTSFLGRIVTYILVLIMLVGIPFSYQFGHSVFYASSVDLPPGRNVEVTVEDGTSFGKLADELYRPNFLISECMRVSTHSTPHRHPDRYLR